MSDELRQIREDLAAVRADVRWIREGMTDHAKRLSEVEKRVWFASGAAGIIGAVLTFAWQWIKGKP